jgi:hypothetical protein
VSGLVPVKFIRPFANYSAGEVAGFHPERAKAMVEGKVAELYRATSKPKAVASTVAAPKTVKETF